MLNQPVLKVCIPHTHHDFFDYVIADQTPVIGARVLVPFGKQKRIGIVIASSFETEHKKLKPIISLLDEEPLLSPSILKLCQWISHYYQSPLSEVIPLSLPKKLRQGEQAHLPVLECYELALEAARACLFISKKAKKQRALIDFLDKIKEAVPQNHILAAGFNKSQIDALKKLNLIKINFKPALANSTGATEKSLALTLNEEQAQVVQIISQHLQTYRCFLLKGVTGSGKTEVYLQLIDKVLRAKRQVLVLVPEIGLTPQLLSRFTARFNISIAVIHSHLNESMRTQAWLAAYHNQAQLVIGTRTAIFTPMPNLGLIIIDEEHDASLKQMDGVRYSARDTALMRASMANIPIILGSATPSLESLYNCKQQKYTLHCLSKKALTSSPLHYQLLDLRNQTLEEGLAKPALLTIAHHLQKGHQVLVFINRRGFAPILLCHACGSMMDCRNCDSHLTLHRSSNRLHCHHCNLIQAIPSACKTCHSKDLIPIGSGTERLYDYLQQKFPQITMLRMDKDSVRKKNEMEQSLDRINQGKVQLIVGTQMLAKGHHFPNLTLVVVVDVDRGFYNQDFRALEQLGQLVTQVAGRAGRAEHPGQVLIQTHLPQHPLLNILVQNGYDAFSEALLDARQRALLPPFHYLALIRAQDKQPAKITSLLQLMRSYLQNLKIEVLGPAPAPLARKASQYRMHLLLKAASRKELQNALTNLRNWLATNNPFRSVRWNIDVDPQDLS